MSAFGEIAQKTFVALAALSIAQAAVADEYHYRNLLIGERAAGMGGAYTAVSDTPDGAFYNPAGIAFITGNSLSASVNAFNHSTKTYENTLLLADGSGKDYEQESSVLLPNFFGVVTTFGGAKVAFSYAVPDSIQREQTQTFTNIHLRNGLVLNNYTININDVDNTYQFGPSLAYKLGKNWSVGTTVYAHYRDSTVIRNQLIELQNGEFEWTNGYQYRTEWGVKPTIGLMGGGNRLAFGLSASRIYILSADNREQITYRGPSSLGYSDPNLVNFTTAKDKKERDFPWNATAGLAWFPTESFLLSADCSYFAHADGDRESVVNLALGSEYYFSDAWAMRLGVYTDRANTPKVRNTGKNQSEHVDLYGGTLSLTRFTRSSSITLGVNYARGNGEAQIVYQDPTRTDQPSIFQDLTVENLGGFLSAAYSY